MFHSDRAHNKIHRALISDLKQKNHIDPNCAFEHVRQLLLSRKVIEAVIYLQEVCTKLEKGLEMENLSVEKKKECLFAFLLKIFMELENEATDTKRDDANNTEKSEEDLKKQEEIKKQERIINYLKVI